MSESPTKRAWRVLEHAEMFHRRLKEYYIRLAGQQSQPRVKLLLDYFSRHQANLEAMMATYEKGVPRVVLDAWFKCIYTDCCLDTLEKVEELPKLTLDEAMELVTKANTCIETNYRRLIESGEEPEVRQFFSELLALEEAEQRKLVRNSQQIVDL